MDEFTRLVENLQSGKLGLTHIQIAIRTHIRLNPNLPEGIKDLLCGEGSNSGLIYRLFENIRQVIGSMELAYRRGTDERKNP